MVTQSKNFVGGKLKILHNVVYSFSLLIKILYLQSIYIYILLCNKIRFNDINSLTHNIFVDYYYE